MRDVLPVAARWAREGRAFAMATVAGVRGSAPRELGAMMLIGEDGTLIGNVSGGCVESAVVVEAEEALASGLATMHTYGISEDAAIDVGLMCGGVIDVLVRPVPRGSAAAQQLCVLAEDQEEPIGFALMSEGPTMGEAHIVGPGGGTGILADAAALVSGDHAQLLHYDAEGCRTQEEAASSVLLLPFGAPPRLIVVGAVVFATALARLGAAMGYRVTVVDARTAFAVPERFPGADEVVAEWPDAYLARTSLDSRCAVAVLSHDPKFDVPALRVALASAAGYVGAMGSRRTHTDRMGRLADAGVTPEQLSRLHSPIGLDLGGRSPEDTALSILAEIVAVRNGASGRPLRARTGELHPTPSAVACAPLPTVPRA